jgi:diaminopimelate decarboxylase
MKSNLSPSEISSAFRAAMSNGWIRGEDTAVIFYDLEFLRERVGHLRSLFPASTLHAIAMKANPLVKVLEFLRDESAGVEAASLGELFVAREAGYPPERIVFDSPVKTWKDLEYALRAGVHINLDSLPELERVAELKKKIPSGSTVGIRINPQVGLGKILESSVAGEYSKFGVPVKQKRKELAEAFLAHEWLTGVHLHVGSQGCPVQMLVDGVGVLYELAEEVNRLTGRRQIRIFDIGGGLPVSYDHRKDPPDMKSYTEKIRSNFPLLFTDHYSLITEFGRWVHVNTGWTASRVEYVKHDPGVNTAMIHTGADLFVRECLNPLDWQHEYTVLDPEGNIRRGTDAAPYVLAGPLCFAGDILAKNVTLPPVREGDYLIIHDTGGYTFSMWSRYNSRQAPRIIGYRGDSFTVLKEREGLEDVARFWE